MSALRPAVGALSCPTRSEKCGDPLALGLGGAGCGGDDARDVLVGLPLVLRFAFGCSGGLLLGRHHAPHVPPEQVRRACIGRFPMQILVRRVTETGARRGTNQVEAQGLTTIMKESR